jgi:RPA family protein
MTEKEMTFGEKAVGLTFNPDGDILVDVVKEQYAQIIDALNGFRNKPHQTPEVIRMLSVAITEAETSQMWAVKAITWKY